jgi:hypothetical protein
MAQMELFIGQLENFLKFKECPRINELGSPNSIEVLNRALLS